MTSELHEAAAQGFSGAAASYEEGGRLSTRGRRPARAGAPPRSRPGRPRPRRRDGQADRPAGRHRRDRGGGRAGRRDARGAGAGAPRYRAISGTAEAIPLAQAPWTRSPSGRRSTGSGATRRSRRSTACFGPAAASGSSGTLPDTSVAWVARLTEIMEPHRGERPPSARGLARGLRALDALRPAGPSGFEARPPPQPGGRVARVASVSFVARLPEPERERVLEEVRNLLATDPETRGRAEVELPYRTDVYWASGASSRGA